MNYALLGVNSTAIMHAIMEGRIGGVEIDHGDERQVVLKTKENCKLRAQVMIDAARDMRARGIDLAPDDINVHFIPSYVAIHIRDGANAWFSSVRGDASLVLNRIVDGLVDLGHSTIYIPETDPAYPHT